jgi:hypothetical protein
MNQNNNKFSKKERILFKSIASHIQANPKDYKEAGKWLDEYCSESAYWTRKKEELEKLKEKCDSFPVLLHQQEVNRLENEIKEKRTPASIIRFQEAQHYLLDNYRDQEFLSKEVAAKIIIITWLLTDPDAGKANLHITEFEKWKWEPLDNVFKGNRDFKGFLFAQNKDLWMRLVSIAWEKINTTRQNITPKIKKESSKFWQSSTFKFVILPLIGTLFLGLPSWFLLFRKNHNPIDNTKTFFKLEENQNLGQQPIISNKGDVNMSFVQNQGIDPNEIVDRFADSQKTLGKTEYELEKIKSEKQDLENIVNAYKREDKEIRAVLERAENIEKTKVMVKIFQEHDKGTITKEEAMKLSDMVNKTLWEDLKSFLENKNIQIDEHNQSLVVSGIFMAKIYEDRLRSRYNPAKIDYVLTPEGDKLYEITKTANLE